MELLLKHGADVDPQDKFCHTPLHMAAANWAIGCAEVLISHLCNIDAVDKLGRTPLHHAAHSGHTEVSYYNTKTPFNPVLLKLFLLCPTNTLTRYKIVYCSVEEL